MKILYVSTMPLEYSSSANMRNLALLKGLQENGHELYLLTQETQTELQHYDETLCNVEFKKKYLLKLGNIHSKVTMKKNKKNILKNIIYNLLIKFKVYDFKSILVKQLEDIQVDEKFDLIISSSDPKSSHLLADKLIKLNPGIAKKWIQYWGDPFASDINNKKFIPKTMIKREEERLISLADTVVYVSPFTLEIQQKIYGKYKEKMRFLPIPYQEKIMYSKTNNQKIKLGYLGDYFSRNRNIIPLYEAIKSDVTKELIICGNSDLNLEKKENIEIYQRQNIKKIRELEENSDILVCVCNKKGTQIPGKIYHYAATNKPILIILDGEYKEELREYFKLYNRFIICDNQKDQILNEISKYEKSEVRYEPLERLMPKNIANEFINESRKS